MISGAHRGLEGQVERPRLRSPGLLLRSHPRFQQAPQRPSPSVLDSSTAGQICNQTRPDRTVAAGAVPRQRAGPLDSISFARQLRSASLRSPPAVVSLAHAAKISRRQSACFSLRWFLKSGAQFLTARNLVAPDYDSTHFTLEQLKETSAFTRRSVAKIDPGRS